MNESIVVRGGNVKRCPSCDAVIYRRGDHVVGRDSNNELIYYCCGAYCEEDEEE